MSPQTRTSKPQQSQPESALSRMLRTASAWVSQRRESTQTQHPRVANLRPDMPVTRDEECLTTHF